MASCAVCGNADVGAVCSLCGSTNETTTQNQATQPPHGSTPEPPTPSAQTMHAPVPTTTPSLPASPSRVPDNKAKLVLGAIAALALLGGLVAVMAGRGRDTVPAASTHTETVTSTATTTTSEAPSSSSEPSEESSTTTELALDRLESLRAESLGRYAPDGRWAIGLSAKRDGITDSTQTTRDGSHTFYLQDILNLHEDLAEYYEFDGAMYLLLAQDIGSAQGPNDDTLWMTVLDPGGLSSREDAQAWCENAFPSASGDKLANICYPRELDAP